MMLLSGLTTFRIGGRCECLYQPEDIEQAVKLLRELKSPVILGNGSNILAADSGVREPVIRMTRLNRIEFSGETVRAGAGVSLPELSRAAMKQGLSGLEWASGIPGSLGGAVVMNAGAYGGEMSQVVTEVLAFDGTGLVGITDFDYSYRASFFLRHKGLTVLEATLRLRRESPEQIRAKMDEFRVKRNEKQPVELPSAGSFFKRPPGHFAGTLIDQCGLKGTSVGGAMVSPKHAGFIVNTGGAACEDVIRLARLVRDTVLRETGVELEPEVRLLGDVSWGF